MTALELANALFNEVARLGKDVSVHVELNKPELSQPIIKSCEMWNYSTGDYHEIKLIINDNKTKS